MPWEPSWNTHTTQSSGFKRVHFNVKNFKVWEPDRGEAVEQKCVKIEKFFLDFYGLVPRQLYIEVDRKEEFAPIKNKEGANDTPLTAYALYSQRNLAKARQVGLVVQEKGPTDYLQVTPELFMNDWMWKQVADGTKGAAIELPACLGPHSAQKPENRK